MTIKTGNNAIARELPAAGAFLDVRGRKRNTRRGAGDRARRCYLRGGWPDCRLDRSGVKGGDK